MNGQRFMMILHWLNSKSKRKRTVYDKYRSHKQESIEFVEIVMTDAF